MDLLIHAKRNLLISNNVDQILFWKKHSDYFFTGVYKIIENKIRTTTNEYENIWQIAERAKYFNLRMC